MTAISPALRGWITAALLISNFMLAIDSTVVNVALPQLQGSLSASPEQITWVVTTYIVAQVVVTPIVGWLAARLGAKTMLLACSGLFTLTSVMCGLATSFPEMVAFRALQGMTGAPMAPLAQAVLLSIYPPERMGRAMALYAMAAVVAPCLGPVLGAWLTEHYSWRWCFFINLPAGLAALAMFWAFLPREPTTQRRFDFLGFFSLGLAVACLQLVLDRGPSKDWFASREIWVEATLAGMGLWVYVSHTLTAREPLFNPAILRDRNFVTSAVLTVMFSLQLYSTVALLPLMSQGVLGYPVMLSGLILLPRGLVMLAVLQVIGRLDAVVDRRLLMGVGLLIMAASCWKMAQFDLGMTPRSIVTATMLQGFGQAIVMVPLVALGFVTLRQDLRAEAAALTNLLRNLGGSAGIAIMQGITVFNGQSMHASLAQHVQPGDPVVAAGLPPALSPETVQGAWRLNEEITRQAGMVAFVNDFLLMAVLSLAAAPLLLLLRPSSRRRTSAASAQA